MIFQHTLDLVLSGRKTATSRLAKAGETVVRGDNGEIVAVLYRGRERYRIGKVYAVQPARAKPAVAQVRLLGIQAQRASETTAEQARAEGVESREAFFAMWRTVHGANKLDADVWHLTFELVHAES